MGINIFPYLQRFADPFNDDGHISGLPHIAMLLARQAVCPANANTTYAFPPSAADLDAQLCRAKSELSTIQAVTAPNSETEAEAGRVQRCLHSIVL